MWKLLLMIVCVLNMTAIQGSLNYKVLDCGIRKIVKKPRMVEAEESFAGQWPWMAFINLTLIYNKETFCGGSLIGTRHILTAAHCVVNLHDKELKPADPGLINVTLGAHNVLKDGEWYGATEMRPHPDFNLIYSQDRSFSDSINDIAVLVLDRDVKLSNYVIPICLPDDYSKNSFESWSAVVAGWGDTSYLGDRSDVLRGANVTVWRNDKCHEEQKNFTRIDENEICAGGRINQDKSICEGDSGGPLMVYDNGKWIVIAVAEGSIDCGELGHPSVFTMATKYLNWIKDQM